MAVLGGIVAEVVDFTLQSSKAKARADLFSYRSRADVTEILIVHEDGEALPNMVPFEIISEEPVGQTIYSTYRRNHGS